MPPTSPPRAERHAACNGAGRHGRRPVAEPAAHIQIDDRLADDSPAPGQARDSRADSAAAQRRAEQHDTSEPQRDALIEHRADHDATQAVRDEVHGVAGHAVYEVRERLRVSFERLTNGGISEALHGEAVAFEPTLQHDHGSGTHPQPVDRDDRGQAERESFRRCNASRLVDEATFSIAASTGSQR